MLLHFVERNTFFIFHLSIIFDFIEVIQIVTFFSLCINKCIGEIFLLRGTNSMTVRFSELMEKIFIAMA